MDDKIIKENIEQIVSKIIANNDEINLGNLQTKEGNYPRDFGMDTWDWTQGVALYGLYNAQSLVDKDLEAYILNWYKEHEEVKVLKNINTTAPMLTLLLEDSKSNKEKIEKWVEWLENDLPKTKYNIFQHTTSNIDGSDILLNDGQIWLDTLFMAVLFMLNYGMKYNESKYVNMAKYQILMHIHYLFNRQDRLFYHGYNFNDDSNFGEIYWLRGNGWMFYALSIILEMLEDDQDYIYDYFKMIFIEACMAIKEHQNENGLWSTVINEDTYCEVSGSCLVATAFLKGHANGILDASYKDSAKACIKEVEKNINEDGSIGQVSAGTSIGMDKEHYENIAIKDMPYGKSLALLLFVEYLKVK